MQDDASPLSRKLEDDSRRAGLDELSNVVRNDLRDFVVVFIFEYATELLEFLVDLLSSLIDFDDFLLGNSAEGQTHKGGCLGIIARVVEEDCVILEFRLCLDTRMEGQESKEQGQDT